MSDSEFEEFEEVDDNESEGNSNGQKEIIDQKQVTDSDFEDVREEDANENQTVSSETIVSSTAQETPPEDTDTKRFVRELEFVQCLANPCYLEFLANQKYFEDPSFLNYLKYLLYWCQPQYAKWIKYPTALHFLKLLQRPDFRAYLSRSQNIQNIIIQLDLFSAYYRRNRLDIQLPSIDGTNESNSEQNQ